MSTTASDTELLDRLQRAIDSWTSVTFTVHRNVWAVTNPYHRWKVCFKIETGAQGNMCTGGALTLRGALEQGIQLLDEWAVKQVTEKLTA